MTGVRVCWRFSLVGFGIVEAANMKPNVSFFVTTPCGINIMILLCRSLEWPTVGHFARNLPQSDSPVPTTCLSVYSNETLFLLHYTRQWCQCLILLICSLVWYRAKCCRYGVCLLRDKSGPHTSTRWVCSESPILALIVDSLHTILLRFPKSTPHYMYPIIM